MGLSYGAAFQALGGIWSIREANGDLLALGELRLPQIVDATYGQYVLHPSLLDGALQACVGMDRLAGAESEQAGLTQQRPMLPFALDRLAVFAPLPERGWTLVRAAADPVSELRKLDVEIADADGRVCAQLIGFSSRLAREEISAEETTETFPMGRPWISSPSLSAQDTSPQTPDEHRAIALDEAELAATDLNVSPALQPGELQGKMQATLIAAASQELKLRGEDIEVDVQLSELGFDSISLTGFAGKLNERFGLQLSPTVFFEYPTLEGLAAHLAAAHGHVLSRFFDLGAGSAPRAPGPAASAAVQPRETRTQTLRRHRRNNLAPVQHADARPASAAAEPIAIIGMSGRFPQARDVHELWDNLLEGRDCIEELPPERWGVHAGELGRQPAGVLTDVDQFDPLFFGISPSEAEALDPHQRLQMMYAWAALEDAGYAPDSLARSATAVLIGTGNSGYEGLLTQGGAPIEGHSAAGVMASIGPNRISYLLDLHGPSEPIDTACSSSLVAVHRAVQLLQSGQCGLAIAGGVNVLASPETHISFIKAGMLSANGRCKTFSAQADGYVRGEGVGMLVLKTRSAAERDGDHIYALIRGTAQNHGGRANSLTAPNPRAQAELIKEALRAARVAPHTVGYIEAHGTGTPLGDPIEVQGLKSAFKELAEEQGQLQLASGSCALGTVKSNIGHLELAAGIAGLIKTVLQMRHRTLVKSLHSEPLNPLIELRDSPFYVVRENQAWRAATDVTGRPLPRRAGVSSFGIGGVNAHVIVEEYVGPERLDDVPEPGGRSIVVVSARSEERLKEQTRRLLAALHEPGPAVIGEVNGFDTYEPLRLSDVSYTLQVGREAMEWRLACVVRDLPQLRERLAAWLTGTEAVEDVYQGQARRPKDVLGLFAADEDVQQAIESWIAKGKLGRLAELWAAGLSFDWRRLYGDGKLPRPRRISLPTYPFAEERYWAPSPSAIAERQKRPVIDIGPVAPPRDRDGLQRDDLQAQVARLLSETLKVPVAQIEPGRSMLEYGMDSMIGMKFKRLLESRFNVPVSGRELLENLTVETLTSLLRAKMTAAHEMQSDAESPLPDGGLLSDGDPPERQKLLDIFERFRHGTINVETAEAMIEGSLAS